MVEKVNFIGLLAVAISLMIVILLNTSFKMTFFQFYKGKTV